jgi:threonine dehydrogenase-like Zn-dependent dehydrogenase
VVVEASGAASGFNLALDLLRPKGKLVLKSTFHGTTEINAARVVVDEISNRRITLRTLRPSPRSAETKCDRRR